MGLTLREPALAAFYALIVAIDGVTADRNAIDEVDVRQLPYINQLDGGHTAVNWSSGGAQYQVSLDLEVFVGGDVPADLGPAISDLWGKIYAAVAADRTLGGVASWVAETAMTDPAPADGEKPYLSFEMGFVIDIEVSETDATTLP